VDCFLIMIKFAYDKYDYMRKRPYPNLWSTPVLIHYNHKIDEYNFDANTQEFILHTCHSELYGNLIDKKFENVVYLNEDITIDDFYFYPIELFGDHRRLINDKLVSKNGTTYYTSFKETISAKAIQMAKWAKLKFVINYSHEPFSDLYFLEKFAEDIKELGLREQDFIFFVGTSNLNELHPYLNQYGFTFLFEDSIITSTARKIKDLQYTPNHTLGYETTFIKEDEIDLNRIKHFVCLNRNSNKPHRYTLGCFFESRNMWDKLYASFLKTNENKDWFYETGDIDFDYEIAAAGDDFAKRLPIEIDTQNSIDKESFEVARAYRKDIYLTSYIYIVTETNFEKDIFLTEKICNPMAVLQPFILFGAYGYLKYLRSIGFKTFDGFIDESYDDEFDDKKRYLKICKEVERLSNMDLKDIHNWYLSIKDILVHNRNHLISFADKVMFKDNLQKIEDIWVTEQKRIEGRL
jgi:hypothetical protein